MRTSHPALLLAFSLLLPVWLLLPTAARAAPQPAVAEERLILAFGDSLTAGYGLRAQESFPAQLEAALEARGHRVRVHNAGVSGDTTAGGRARLAWVMKSLPRRPVLAILELGANDMLRGMDPARARDNLDAMLLTFKQAGVPVILAGMFASPTLGDTYMHAFNSIYPDLARKHGATLYPFFMKGVLFNDTYLLPDRLHPNERGVAVIVRNILPTVTAALEARPAPPAKPTDVPGGATSGGPGGASRDISSGATRGAAPVRRD